ncbi:MAG: glycosyltransferase involved in cell wall biosynthesis, partial [Gammaproteobacteria bacterium]
KNTIPAIGVHNYFNTEDWADPSLQSYSGIDHKAPVGLFLGIPYRIPEFFYQHNITIGAFVCEFDRIPEHWVYICNRLDLVLVPSKFCRDAFANSGVKSPLLVVPHGLEPAYRPYSKKKRGDKLVFYNTFYSTSLNHRKSLEELVCGFLRAFEGRSDVVLRLRTDHSPALMNCQKSYDFGGLIDHDLLTATTSTENYARIFSEVHCTVHPSKSEGFGLVPFQSIACETPVIAPYSTGMADYLNESNSLQLRTGKPIPGSEPDSVGNYFSVDEDHLVEQLRYMAANWEDEYCKVKGIAERFRISNSWPNALSDLVRLVEGLVRCNGAEEAQRQYLSNFMGD